MSILDGIGFMIAEIVKNKKGKIKALSRDFTAEIKIAEQKAVGIGDVRKSDVKQNIFACPDCDGGLWEIKKNHQRISCHIGHAYTKKTRCQNKLKRHV